MTVAEGRVPSVAPKWLGPRAPAPRRILVAGGAGGAAMIPVGVALELGGGYDVNVYGELTVTVMLGSAPGWALLFEHILISLALAVPLVRALDRRGRAPAVAIGIVYGAGAWLVLNSLLLPAAFARPTPWALGWEAIWPSLLLHLVYGGVGAGVLTRLEPRPRSHRRASGPRASSARCSRR